jgi:hypothetical protein
MRQALMPAQLMTAPHSIFSPERSETEVTRLRATSTPPTSSWMIG